MSHKFFSMSNSNFYIRLSALEQKRKTRFQASLILVLSLAIASVVVIPSSSYSSSSILPSSPFPYIPGLGPANADASSSVSASNNTGVVGQINHTTDLRSYENSAFGVNLQYPADWGAVELKSSPLDDKSPGSSIALFTAPIENASDIFREKALLSIQDFTSAGNTLERDMNLARYTNESLGSYNNTPNSVTILESNATILAGKPAHRIVFTENVQNQQLKKTQVWTVDDNKAYVITFSAEESRYADYLPSVENMIGSLQINASQVSDKATTSRNTPTGMADLTSQSNATTVPESLTFSEESAGIEMQYPETWTKVQPGAPLDARTFSFLVSFISPAANNISTSSTDNSSASFSRVNIGIHDLRPSDVSGTANSTLDQYSAFQTDSINRQGANILESEETKLGGLPAHRISYTHGDDENEKQTLQIWTLKGNIAYHFIYTADKDNFSQHLSEVQNMANSMQLK
jgi:hypothetical protein